MSDAAAQTQEAPDRAPQTPHQLAAWITSTARDSKADPLARSIMQAINDAQVQTAEAIMALAQVTAPVLAGAPDPRLCADAYGVILGAAMPGAIANVTLLRSQAAGHG